MGIGQIDPRYQGKRFGYMAVLLLARKIVKDFNVDAFFHVRRGNTRADQDLKDRNAQLIDTFSWISVEQNNEPCSKPLFGRL